MKTDNAFIANVCAASDELVAYTPPAAPAAPERDVTKIMLDIAPGPDGMGVEVYAKSVSDVEQRLTRMGQELEEWQLGMRRLPDQTPAPAPAAQGLSDAEILTKASHNGMGGLRVEGTWESTSDGRRVIKTVRDCIAASRTTPKDGAA